MKPNQPTPPAPSPCPKAATPPRVIALAGLEAPLMRAMALEMAGHGHTLALIGSESFPADSAQLLELQFALDRAGAISLCGTSPNELDWVYDAFGRLDAAVLPQPALAAELVEAWRQAAPTRKGPARAAPQTLLVATTNSPVACKRFAPNKLHLDRPWPGLRCLVWNAGSPHPAPAALDDAVNALVGPLR